MEERGRKEASVCVATHEQALLETNEAPQTLSVVVVYGESSGDTMQLLLVFFMIVP